MTHQPAPEPFLGETPQAYVVRVCQYLTEPHRRRLGDLTSRFVQQAITVIDGDTTPSTDTLTAVAKLAAEQPIEDMVDYDSLREAADSYRDIADRIDAVLKDAKLWWHLPTP